MDGPKMSVSSIPARSPFRASDNDVLTLYNRNVSHALHMPMVAEDLMLAKQPHQRAGLQCLVSKILIIPAMVDFPTPPLADETATTFLTPRMLRFSGKPRCIRGICGGAPERGRPWNSINQSASYIDFLLIKLENKQQPYGTYQGILMVETCRS